MLIAKTYHSSYGKGEPPNHHEFTVVRRDKSLPRIRNTSQNPKHFPESKTRPKTKSLRIQKHFPESIKTLPGIQKHFPESINTLPRIQNTFGFWDLYLDSGKYVFSLWATFYQKATVLGMGWVETSYHNDEDVVFQSCSITNKDQRKFMTFTLHPKCGWCITNG